MCLLLFCVQFFFSPLNIINRDSHASAILRVPFIFVWYSLFMSCSAEVSKIPLLITSRTVVFIVYNISSHEGLIYPRYSIVIWLLSRFYSIFIYYDCLRCICYIERYALNGIKEKLISEETWFLHILVFSPWRSSKVRFKHNCLNKQAQTTTNTYDKVIITCT